MGTAAARREMSGMKQFDYSLIMEPVSCDVAALPLTVTADVGSEMIFFLHM